MIIRRIYALSKRKLEVSVAPILRLNALISTTLQLLRLYERPLDNGL
jgi:hypothetical protein